MFDSPERKAALDKALREKIKLIQDPSIRQHYGQEIKDLRWDLFRAKRSPAARPAGGSFNRGGLVARVASTANADAQHEIIGPCARGATGIWVFICAKR